ncbi:hypothetical protein AcV7_005521 [Taiwanofungus camphoratus]|nr:hypothetical protein AcV7_005521 [Antrodia cinnamomea]
MTFWAMSILLDLIDEMFRETIMHPELMGVGMELYTKMLVRYKKALMEVFNDVFNTEICDDIERGRLAECVKAKVYLHLSPLSTLLWDAQFAPFPLMMKSMFLAMKNELRKFSHSLMEYVDRHQALPGPKEHPHSTLEP